MKNSSPFHQSNFVPISKPYFTEGKVWGLKQPDGKIIVNYDASTSYAMMKEIAELTKTELITVKGRWAFTPIIVWECPGCERMIEVPGDEEAEEHDDKVWHPECWASQD